MPSQIRATLTAAAFYITTAIFLIFGSPLLFAPRSWAMVGLRVHARTCLWVLKWVGGTTYEVRGRDNIPNGPCLVVAKHQSPWETFALIPLFRDPAIVLKAELARIPLYGHFCRAFDHILVARERQAVALKRMVDAARERAAAGREIVIFAEGTRTEPGAEPAYKPGYLALYDALDLPLVPVALNSGLMWPGRSSLCYAGHIVVDIAPPIAPGLPRAEIRGRVTAEIETRSTDLIREAARRTPDSPRVAQALARLDGTQPG